MKGQNINRRWIKPDLKAVFGAPDQPGLPSAISSALFSDNAHLLRQGKQQQRQRCSHAINVIACGSG